MTAEHWLTATPSPCAAAEQWKDIPSWEDFYQVSSRGQVRGVDRIITRRNGKPYRAKGRVLRPQPHRNSWVQTVTLARAGHKEQYCVHKLVQQAFGDDTERAA